MASSSSVITRQEARIKPVRMTCIVGGIPAKKTLLFDTLKMARENSGVICPCGFHFYTISDVIGWHGDPSVDSPFFGLVVGKMFTNLLGNDPVINHMVCDFISHKQAENDLRPQDEKVEFRHIIMSGWPSSREQIRQMSIIDPQSRLINIVESSGSPITDPVIAEFASNCSVRYVEADLSRGPLRMAQFVVCRMGLTPNEKASLSGKLRNPSRKLQELVTGHHTVADKPCSQMSQSQIFERHETQELVIAPV